MQGKFIVLEGPDGSGTSLQSAMLSEKLRLENHDVLHTVEPTDSAIGSHIREILSSNSLPPAAAVQLLFCSDRAQHVHEAIIPALEAGQTVVCDRYALSTIVYGTVQGLNPEWLRSINAAFPQPDLTIITLPPYEITRERLGRRDEQDQFEEASFHKKIYDAYAETKADNIVFVDTSGEKEASADLVWQHVSTIL